MIWVLLSYKPVGKFGPQNLPRHDAPYLVRLLQIILKKKAQNYTARGYLMQLPKL